MITDQKEESAENPFAGFRWGSEIPLAVASLDNTEFGGRSSVPLVQLFTANEQRARSSQAYIHSSIGDRLRVTGHTLTAGRDHHQLVVTQ